MIHTIYDIQPQTRHGNVPKRRNIQTQTAATVHMSFLAMCSSQRLGNNLTRNSDTCSRVEAIIRVPAVANTRTHRRHGTGQVQPATAIQHTKAGAALQALHHRTPSIQPAHKAHCLGRRSHNHTQPSTSECQRVTAMILASSQQWSSMHARSPHTRVSPITCWQTHAGMVKK